MPDYNKYDSRQFQRQADVARGVASNGNIQQKYLTSNEFAKNSELFNRINESLDDLEFSLKNPKADLDTPKEFKAEIGRITTHEGWEKAASFESDYNTVFKLVMNGHGDPEKLAETLNNHSLFKERHNSTREMSGYGEAVVQKFISETRNNANARSTIQKAYSEPSRLDQTGWAHNAPGRTLEPKDAATELEKIGNARSAIASFIVIQEREYMHRTEEKLSHEMNEMSSMHKTSQEVAHTIHSPSILPGSTQGRDGLDIEH